MTNIVDPRDLGTMQDYQPPVGARARLRIFWLRMGFLVLPGLTGLILWLTIDLVSYASQRVSLDHVGEYCFARYTGRRSSFHPPTNPTKDCEGLKIRLRKDPRLWRYRLVKDTFVTFSYTSPADGKLHPGMLRRRLNDAGQLARAGDEIVIHASRLFAVTFTDWSSASATKE